MNGAENEPRHTILCVDDEKNILNALRRLLRKENLHVLTAESGKAGLSVLDREAVDLVVSDQRMPEMSGVEFLEKVKARFPDVIRMILTGYTDVNAITESVNKGHIYKFLFKPWDDNALVLEIRGALHHHDLIASNKALHKKLMEQNQALREINEELERRVRGRTQVLEIQNRALELSRDVLDIVPLPVVGVSTELMVVLMNQMACETFGHRFGIGDQLDNGLLPGFVSAILEMIDSGLSGRLPAINVDEVRFSVEGTPLPGRAGALRGVVLTFRDEYDNIAKPLHQV